MRRKKSELTELDIALNELKRGTELVELGVKESRELMNEGIWPSASCFPNFANTLMHKK